MKICDAPFFLFNFLLKFIKLSCTTMGKYEEKRLELTSEFKKALGNPDGVFVDSDGTVLWKAGDPLPNPFDMEEPVDSLTSLDLSDWDTRGGF